MAGVSDKQKSSGSTKQKPHLPHGWTIRVSKTYPDRIYYFNAVTGATSWELPGLITSESQQAGKVKKRKRRKKHPYGHKCDSQQKLQPQQQDCNNDANKGQDLNCDCIAELQSEAGIKQSSPLTPDSEVVSGQTRKQTGEKRYWKKFWDLPAGVFSSKFSEDEPKDLSLEELEIIRFPNCRKSHVTESGNLSASKISSGKLQQAIETKIGCNDVLVNKKETDVDQGQSCYRAINSSLTSSSSSGSPTSCVPKINTKRTKSSVMNNISVRSGQTAGQASAPSKSQVTVEYRTGVKVCDSVQKVGRNGRNTKGRTKVKKDTPIIEFRQGCLPAPCINQKLTETLRKVSSSDTPGDISSAPLVQGVLEIKPAGTNIHKESVDSRKTGAHFKANKLSENSDQSESTNRKFKYQASCGDVNVNSFGNKTCTASPLQLTSSNLSVDYAEHGSDNLAHQSVSGGQLQERKILKARRSNEKLTSSEIENVTSSRLAESSVTADQPQTSADFPLEAVEGTLHNSGNISGQGLPLEIRNTNSVDSSGDVQARHNKQNRKSRRKRQSSLDLAATATDLSPGLHQKRLRGDSLLKLSCSSQSKVDTGMSQTSFDTIVPNAFPFSPVLAADNVHEDTKSCLAAERDIAMEVDDDNDQIMLDLQELRENFKPDMKMMAMGMLTESVQQTTVSRPSTPLEGLTAIRKKVYVVVDTNVLIGSLKFVQNLRDMSLKDYGQPYLIIPWIVLQELDAIKRFNLKKMSREKKAQDAVRYLHACLVSKHPRVRGQTPAEASEVVDPLPVQCNDDRVLQCCLQYQHRYGKQSVILLTDDLNLQNKAVVMEINCFSTKTLLPLLTSAVAECTSDPSPSNPNDSGERAGSVATSSASGVPGLSTERFSTNRISQESCDKIPQSLQLPAATDDYHRERQQKIVVDELLCGVNSALKAALISVVEAEMKEAFGDLWSEIVYRKPPWSAHDLALILQKHWIAVFGMKMDRELKVPVDHLALKLKPETATRMGVEEVQELLCCSLQLLAGVHKYSPCEDAVKQLEKLIQKAKELQLASNIDKSSRASSTTCIVKSYRESSVATDRILRSSDSTLSSSRTISSSSQLDPTGTAMEQLIDPSVKKSGYSLRRKNSVVEETLPLEAKNEKSQLLNKSTNQGSTWTVRQMSTEEEKDEPITSRSCENAQLGGTSVNVSTSSSTHGRDAQGTVNCPPSALSSSSHQMQVPKVNTAEEETTIRDLFQAIWSTIFNFCTNVESLLMTSANHADVSNITETLSHLFPLVKQIHSQFSKCLSFSPVGLDRHTARFSEFCSVLNDFFIQMKMPCPLLCSINSGNMIVFMADTKNRVTLYNGLKQLDSMVAQLQSLTSRLSG